MTDDMSMFLFGMGVFVWIFGKIIKVATGEK